MMENIAVISLITLTIWSINQTVYVASGIHCNESLQLSLVTGQGNIDDTYDTITQHNNSLDVIQYGDTDFNSRIYRYTMTESMNLSAVRVPCEQVGYMSSVLRQRASLLVPTANEMLGSEHHRCRLLESGFVARTVYDILQRQLLDSLVIFYTEIANKNSRFRNRFLNYLFNDTKPLYIDLYVDYKNALLNFMTDTDRIFVWRVEDGEVDESTQLLWDSFDYSIQGVVALTGQENQRLIAKARSQNMTFDPVWVIADETGHKTLEGVLHPTEKVVIVDISHSQSNCQVIMPQEVYYPIWTFSLEKGKYHKVGEWSARDGLDLYQTAFWEFEHFENKTFTIVTKELPVFHYKDIINGTEQWTGICIEMLKNLANALNFNYQLVEPPDDKWGAPEADGTWNGMVGMVYRGEVDFALGKFTVTSIRDSVIDYVRPFWYEPTVMLQKKPEPDSLLIYAGPFQWQVWLVLAISLPVGSVAIALVALAQDVWSKSLSSKKASETMNSTFSFTYGAILLQGSSWMPRSQSVRFVVGFWWFFSIVVTATYTGNLIAVLAVPKVELPIQSVSDLASQSRYNYGVQGGTALSSLFQLSSFTVYKKMWQKEMQYESNMVSSHEEGFERVKAGSYVYITEKSGIVKYIYKDCCCTLAKEEFFPSSFAFVFSENSPYIPIFNKKITNMIENGLTERWRKQFYPLNKCAYAESSMADSAKLKDTQGAFILLAFGMVISVGILFLEFYKNSRSKPVTKIKPFSKSGCVEM